jgi:arylsulfatase A-like enzyme
MSQLSPAARNVMFIVIDQFRADMLFGDLAAHVALPNLHALMADALSFTRHFSVTNPCGPSRASLLTGQYAMNHRSIRNGSPLRHDTPNLATEARKLGCEPLLFGYTDTSQDPRIFPPNDPALRSYEHPMRGFTEALEMRSEQSYPWRADLIAKGYILPANEDFYKPAAPAKPALGAPAFYRGEDSDTAFLTDRCLQNLSARGTAPWFAHLTYIRPHPPLIAPAPYHAMYDPQLLPLPTRLQSAADEAAVHPFFGPALAHETTASMVQGLPDLPSDDPTVQQLRATYFGLATEVDHHIGRVIAFLKDSGQYDSTLLVVTADHGEMLGDRHAWGKMNVYDAAFHTPLIIRDPLNVAMNGKAVSATTESIDVTPTILDWIGQDRPASMDGQSVLPFLRGEAVPWRQHSYSEFDCAQPTQPTHWQNDLGIAQSEGAVAILRGPRFSLVQFAADLPPMLFDHHGQGELQDLASDPAHAAPLLMMTQTLLRHRMRFADQTLSTTTITADGPMQGAR